MSKVLIHSDVACHGNTGPGDSAAVLICGEQKREISSGVSATTNNRMELHAAIEPLRVLNRSCTIEFHTDFNFVCHQLGNGLVIPPSLSRGSP